MNIEVKKTLQDVGLSKDETEIYLAGLELGESSVQNLARQAKVKRPTAYKIIDALIAKGLFYQTFQGKKRFFGAQNPKDLEVNLNRKATDLAKIMPELNSIYNIPEFKPRVRFYEGLAGAMAVYEDTLSSTPENGEILSCTGIKNIFEIFPEEYAVNYINRRVQKNIREKIIAIDSEESRKWQKNSEKELREIILASEDQFDFSGDMEIYGDKVALISYQENFMAVVIESKEIAKMQKFIFNLSWKNFKIQNPV